MSPELRHSALSLVRARYHDFGPTLACEKLKELHGLSVSVEALRLLMTTEGLWVPHRRRGERIQQPRRRRDCFGELIQIDGCDHHWFEERGARCTLLVFIDDATGKLAELYNPDPLLPSSPCAPDISTLLDTRHLYFTLTSAEHLANRRWMVAPAPRQKAEAVALPSRGESRAEMLRGAPNPLSLWLARNGSSPLAPSSTRMR